MNGPEGVKERPRGGKGRRVAVCLTPEVVIRVKCKGFRNQNIGSAAK